MKTNVDHLMVEILRDIDDYEKRSILGMTVRQFRWVVIAIVVSVPVMFPFRWIGLDSAGYLMTFITAMGVFLLGGFAKWHGRPYSDFVKSVIKYYRTEQRLLYVDPTMESMESEVKSNAKKTRKDRSINRRLSEHESAKADS